MERHPLTEWIEGNAVERKRFAAALGVSTSTISRYESGERKPRVSLAHKIERTTLGGVPANVWRDRERELQAGETPGSRLLVEWMSRHGLTIREAAQFFGLHARTIRDLIHSSRRPSRSTISRLRQQGPAEFANIRGGDFEL